MHQLDNVSVVEDVRKLPHPHFPLKKYNYQHGGSLHVEANVDYYYAVYVPTSDCEFKGVNLCCTSYNIEDTYDVMIGSKFIIKNSHVKEMAEYRILENYEVVLAGTPITIRFHNVSGLQKFLLYDMITLVDESVINNENNLTWNFSWLGTDQMLGSQDTLSLIINQPDNVNLQSAIESFTLNIDDNLVPLNSWTIHCLSSGAISSTYIETEPEYTGLNLLGRVNVIGITSVIRYSKSIEILFKNLNQSELISAHNIEMIIGGSVVNNINGGI
jgi:hypothetical protein